MKHVINKLAPYIIAVFIFLIFNIIVYNYLIYHQKKEYALLLKGYTSSIANLLTQDLENALNNSSPNKKFFLLKDFEIITRSKPAVNLIIVTPDVIKVKNLKEEYILGALRDKKVSRE